jgi:hypothetical protein
MGPLEPPTAPPEPDGLSCPWCGAGDIERLSLYGPMHMSEQWFCRVCHSPFERVRNRN